ncbi:MAG: hypothetical protein AAB065_04170, partial [Deltaproteobacteria bacterium]
RFFFIAIIAFATFNMNFVARYATGAGDICRAHGGACPHHHRDKAVTDEHLGHDRHHNGHHANNNEKSLKCDCKKDYENSGLYTIPLPSQKTAIASFADLKEKSFESKTFHSNHSLSPPETPPRA